MLSSSRPLRVLALLAALAFTTAACDSDTTEPGEGEPIALGGLFSLTGNWQTLGITGKAAMELAVEDVNAQLTAGGSAVRFKADIMDTKLDPADALADAKTLYARGVRVLIGPQSSAEVVALKDWANTTGALIVSPSSTAGTLAIAGDNVMRLTPGDSLEATALIARFGADNVEIIIPFWRDDAGNDGLAIATRSQFTEAGGTVATGVEYGANVTNFAAALASLRTQIVAAQTANPDASIAIAHAGFDEVVDIMKLAAADPVFRSIRWYGTDGTALNAPLRASAEASAFAAAVGFVAPIFGLDPSATARWQSVYNRISTRAAQAPDAFAMAVYDAVWIAANAYLTQDLSDDIDVDHLRSAMTEAARNFYGTTGWTVLNAAGDRQFGNFDFFALKTSPSTAWTLAGRFNTQTRTYTRIGTGLGF